MTIHAVQPMTTAPATVAPSHEQTQAGTALLTLARLLATHDPAATVICGDGHARGVGFLPSLHALIKADVFPSAVSVLVSRQEVLDAAADALDLPQLPCGVIGAPGGVRLAISLAG